MKTYIQILLAAIIITGCYPAMAQVVAKGHMPNVVTDAKGTVHMVYGTNDSIMYLSSGNGRSFTKPQLVATLTGLFASAMRGPQIAASNQGITISACTKNGNIFSYNKRAFGTWTSAVRVNDINEVAKEALIDLSGNNNLTYAVWLAAKPTRGQEIHGAFSTDGGRTWQKNVLVYASPDSSVCECCKPSVVVQKNKVAVMFRNWLNKSRDLYVASSTDGGKHFIPAQKLGEGTWKLNGCPMDGGGLTFNDKGDMQTVWRRENKIYAAEPGEAEHEIGEGKGCTIASTNGKNVYAWSQNGTITLRKPNGSKADLGKGIGPLLTTLKTGNLLCVWEHDGTIESAVVEM